MSEENITKIYLDGKEIILIGTAHVSRHSAEQVKEVIDQEQPDSVCIELDEQRYQSVMEGSNWQEMDIFKVVKERNWQKTDIIKNIKYRKATIILINLAISFFKNRLTKQDGIKPGVELLQRNKSAKEIHADLLLADRYIPTTFTRIWRKIGFK